MKSARIENNRVVNISDESAASVDARFVVCPDDVVKWDYYDSENDQYIKRLPYQDWDEVAGRYTTDITKLKQYRKSEVNVLNSKFTNGNYIYGENAFQADEPSRVEISKTTQFANSVINGSATEPWSAKNTWKNIEGVRITFNTPEDFVAFSEGIYLRTENNLENADNHENTIEAMSTEQEILDYDITTGWTE